MCAKEVAGSINISFQRKVRLVGDGEYGVSIPKKIAATLGEDFVGKKCIVTIVQVQD